TDTIRYSKDGSSYTLTTKPTYKEVGTYTTYVKVSRSGYQDWYGSATVVINALPEITNVSVTGWSGSYNGKSHSITVTDPNSSTDTIRYSKDGSSYTLTTKPTYKEVGTYTTYVKVSRSGYQDWYGSATVVIEAPSSSVVVTTALDVVDDTDNLTSLREAISDVSEGGKITFASSLRGKTITLSGTELAVEKGITIDASSIGGITIDANQESRVFCVTGGSSAVPVTLVDLVIIGGNADNGGGIYNSRTLKLANCVVTKNSATRYGGGIYNLSGTLTLSGSVISANSADANVGGGIYTSGTLTLSGSTVSGNTSKNGGGIYISSGKVTLTNTILSSNYAASNSDVRGSYSGSHNLVGDDAGFVVAPVFANGKLTNADALDLSLSAGSAAINAGTNDAVETEIDIVGNPRIFGGTVDIGAYEFQRDYETPSTVVTTLLDVIDNTDGLISLREAISCASAGDTITFDAALTGRRIVLDGEQLVIDKSITIDGSSVGGITIDADEKSRVFYIPSESGAAVIELISLTITGANLASYYGGGIFNESGTLTITNSTISGNTAGWGGGIYNYGTLTIMNSTISGNTASYYGGGIFNRGTLTITNSTISGNTASYYYGGGICNSSGTISVINSTISGNIASYYGGGIYNSATLTITNSTISGNTASGYGGGIYNDEYHTLTLENTIISLNCAGYNDNDVWGSYSGSYNLVGDNPRFVTAPVFSNGELVNADEIDLSLAAGSVAINAGTNDAVTTETDIAGNPRIVGGTVDIGAYEYVGSVAPTELNAPVITSGSRGIHISYGANRHYLQWGAVAGASGYEVQYSTGGSNWTTVSASGTSAVVTGLTYGTDVKYRVRALGAGSYTDSGWSAVKTFNVCPMDINGDGDIAGSDRTIMATSWLAEEGDEDYQYYADINGDGEVSNTDRPFIGQNWNKEVGDDDLVYPRALRAADAVFAEYASADPDTDLGIF
ncbi:MAG: hypothetical protein J6S40_09790, partial [Thermoguttaceae bacterium]|nr:hypothetical protein [Thermoguttaceae bacterium]